MVNNGKVHFRDTSKEEKISEANIQNILKEVPDAHIYICGPEQYEKHIIESLKKNHVLDDRIHVESFVQAGAPSDAPQTITF